LQDKRDEYLNKKTDDYVEDEVEAEGESILTNVSSARSQQSVDKENLEDAEAEGAEQDEVDDEEGSISEAETEISSNGSFDGQDQDLDDNAPVSFNGVKTYMSFIQTSTDFIL
jgi:hypothetical protein